MKETIEVTLYGDEDGKSLQHIIRYLQERGMVGGIGIDIDTDKIYSISPRNPVHHMYTGRTKFTIDISN
jgi:hypothetical protein